MDVVRADGEQDEIELRSGSLLGAPIAISVRRARRSGRAPIRDRRRRCPATGHSRARWCRGSRVDGGAGAGERNEGDGEVRILDRERERGAHLIAVERAMAGAAHPARALPRPIARLRDPRPARAAGLVAVEAGAAGPEIFDRRRSCESRSPRPKAGSRGPDCLRRRRWNRPCRRSARRAPAISVDEPLRGAVRQHDVDARERRAAVAHAQLHFVVAGGVHLPGRAVAVVEAPGADRRLAAARPPARRRCDGRAAPDRFRARRRARRIRAACRRGRRTAARPCRAPSRGRRSRAPGAARPRARRRRARGDVALEIGLVAEQAEAVLDFPFDRSAPARPSSAWAAGRRTR